ncbi:ATP-binding cassette domain-containing protein [Sulfurimonas sp.]|uniref:ATP-binding cassette domain-containing protein n=1 Tax=Sulfurimonas sp. TaxID=2022749 RepID=UPI003D0E7D39
MIRLDFTKKLQGAEGIFDLVIRQEIPKEKLSILFGKSGAGKSTILKILAGLIKPDSGEIVVDNVIWFSSAKKINLPPQKRSIGFVFQDYALFPNMSVQENLLYALEHKSDRKSVDEILELMELTSLKDAKPNTLSGGQQQRVAVARALVRKPKILLLDEPLSALDFAMRAKLQDEFLALQHKLKTTTLLVSHDISEVYKLGDFVYEIKEGLVAKSGTPSEIFGGVGISGKFKFNGEVVAITKSDILYIVSVLVESEIVKAVAGKKEVQNLKIGSRVVLSSKAFNPLIVTT